eukprot:11022203-Alexandrium_andersonii.AAC.1
MSASLVGSEMCIRDSPYSAERNAPGAFPGGLPPPGSTRLAPPARAASPVSYTHLTLPTICSV